MPDDALTIAIAETGVAVRAFDSDRLRGKLCIRDSAPGESLPGKRTELQRGTLVLADERAPLELLFGGEAEGVTGRETRRLTLAAVRVKNVPEAAVDEALWIARSVIES